MQWCDPNSLDWFRFLLMEACAPVLIVGTLGLEYKQHNPTLSNFLHTLGDSVQITQIELGMLNYAKTVELAEQLTRKKISPEQAAWLYQETEGNPWFVVEMLYVAGWQCITTGWTALPP